ncbi:MAG: LysR family transcriptional regulator [Chloroflexi bacterium]|nr:LysR family transcriptional regulator [Chloroflexota bacterium]
MLTLQQLQVFRTVARHLHFTRAAEALNLTQPAVTFHIRSLERQMRLQLFEVQGHKVILTEAGEFLLQRAEEVLNAVDATERSMREFAELQEGWLNLGATLTIGNYVLPPVVTRFSSSYPRIRLSMEIANTAEMEKALLARQLDLAVVEWKITSPEIEVIPFQTDELLVAVPVGHPLAAQKEVEIERLAQEPLVLREKGSGTRALALETFGPLVERLKIALELNGTEAIKRSVQAGLGVTIISHTIIKEEVKRGEIAALRVAGRHMERDFALAYLRGRALSPAALSFMAMILGNSPEFSVTEPTAIVEF